MKKKTEKTLTVLAILLLACGCVISGVNLLSSAEVKGFLRQKEEERVAESYIKNISVNTQEAEEETTLEDPQTGAFDYTDDTYFIREETAYTPDYAKGHIDCVLEIPKIRLRRGVYTGTAEEIQHDLDVWMTVAASPGYQLGKTHYVIYGHNAPAQDLSFNRLADLEAGDYFVLTTSSGVYLYDVTKVYAEWRTNVTYDIAENYDLPADSCYIITCGRDEYRYRDLVVLGALREVYAYDEWQRIRDTIGKADVLEKEKTPEAVLSGEVIDGSLSLSVTLPDGSPVSGISCALADKDGIFIEGRSAVTNEDGVAVMPLMGLPEGTYVAGTVSWEREEASPPKDVTVTVSLREKTGRVETVGKEAMKVDSHLIIWAGTLFATVILIILCIHTIRKAGKRHAECPEKRRS